MTTTREILNRAADLVEQGWCQGVYESIGPNGPRFCLAGALEKAAGELDCDSDHFQEILGLVRKRVLCVPEDPKVSGILSAWSDDPSRTQSEVVALLREVAAEQG